MPHINNKSKKCRRKASGQFSTASQVRSVTKSSPNFPRIAAQAIQL